MCCSLVSPLDREVNQVLLLLHLGGVQRGGKSQGGGPISFFFADQWFFSKLLSAVLRVVGKCSLPNGKCRIHHRLRTTSPPLHLSHPSDSLVHLSAALCFQGKHTLCFLERHSLVFGVVQLL